MHALTQIAGTLKHGQFDGTKRKKILIAFLAFTIILIVGLIGLIIALSLEQVNKTNPMPTANFVFLIIGVSIGFLILPVVWLILITKNEKAKKEIILWLQDAVELGAYCERLSDDYT
ncbi:MAG: hypothetical protein K2J83_04910, partial [Clostridia bacterium]|nr:hypothetical protein [Clostridia bacterium]